MNHGCPERFIRVRILSEGDMLPSESLIQVGLYNSLSMGLYRVLGKELLNFFVGLEASQGWLDDTIE